MKKNSEHPEFLVGAFVPIGIALLGVVSGILFLVTEGAWRIVFATLGIIAISVASGILGAIWMSRR